MTKAKSWGIRCFYFSKLEQNCSAVYLFLLYNEVDPREVCVYPLPLEAPCLPFSSVITELWAELCAMQQLPTSSDLLMVVYTRHTLSSGYFQDERLLPGKWCCVRRGGIEMGKLNQCSVCLPNLNIFFSLYTHSHLLYHPPSLTVPWKNMPKVHPLLFLGFAVFSLLLTRQVLVKVWSYFKLHLKFQLRSIGGA